MDIRDALERASDAGLDLVVADDRSWPVRERRRHRSTQQRVRRRPLGASEPPRLPPWFHAPPRVCDHARQRDRRSRRLLDCPGERRSMAHGRPDNDVLPAGLADRRLSGEVDDADAALVEPLLQPVMRGGEIIAESPSLNELQQRARAQIAALPAGVRNASRLAKIPRSERAV